MNKTELLQAFAENLLKASKDGIKITNGDVIKAMFPNLEWSGAREDVDFYLLDSETPYSAKLNTFRSWWNAPYKAESEEQA